MSAPKLSVIVIAYRMAAQLENTLYSLSPAYQRGIGESEYEVLVMENDSGDNLDPGYVAQLPPNFRYYLRNETAVTPVPAINEAFDQCRAPFVCLMIDGARMLSPGALAMALAAARINPEALVAVPGYHLGDCEQHMANPAVSRLDAEREMLEATGWRDDGYELFRVATFSGANGNGYLQPMMECNCMFASLDNFERIGFADTTFTQPGGGSINLHMYRALGMLPDTELFVLPGEGSFHQFHGGVTTSAYDDREAELERHRTQLHSKWPGGFHALRREPQLLGAVPAQAQSFLARSLELAEKRYQRLTHTGKPLWPDDTGR